MLFSVVVPTHHRLNQLQRLLTSLAKQTLENNQFEVIVVPSPRDQSLKWLSDYAKTTPYSLTIHLPFPDPYEGRSASFKRNSGVDKATAPWIAFIDDDCIADPNWLSSALPFIEDSKIHGIEGLTKIPPPEKMTHTYKGLQRLSQSGGYQTCNMFYRKKTFKEIGGFDLNFPFYLEDTDLAWSFLDNNKQIVFSEASIVLHPVPPPDVDRLLDNAMRTRKIPYLFRKHPEQFAESHFRPLSRSQWTYLFVYFGTIYSFCMSPSLKTLIFLMILVLGFHAAYVFRILSGCTYEKEEFKKIFLYLLITPPISLFQLIRGNIDNRTFVFF
jgi:GT2 family glycosyltransferase